jgi:DUF4097 and DUF4098 domain-containing protein YvlB
MEEKIEKTFETPDGCDLTVENVRGAITVLGWDQNTTQIVATTQNGSANVEIGQEGRTITARTKHEQGALGWLDWLTGNKPPLVDYKVHVPHASNLRLKNVSGPISAQEVKGEVRVNDVDGTAVLTAIEGDIRAETVNGSLQAEGIKGTAKLHTVNGRMHVQESTLQALNADTVNGDIEVRASFASGGEYTFHTVNGSCRLMLANAPYASVSAHGVNMSVDCRVAADNIERSMGSWKATIGTGEGPRSSIRFDTVNGRLYIDGPAAGSEAPAETFVAKSQPVPEPLPAAAPPPPVDPVEAKVVGKSQAEILQMVERGEISVDEAINMLQEAK